MTEEKQLQKMRLEILSDINNTDKDEVFKTKLEDAKWLALDTLYPFNKEIIELPERYHNWQVRCAIELYSTMGQEGYISYSENGLSYTKACDLVSKELMNQLTPKADIPR